MLRASMRSPIETFRSALAADNLQKMGYTNVISMDGGVRGWKEADLPVVKD